VGQLDKLRADCQSALYGFPDTLVLWLRPIGPVRAGSKFHFRQTQAIAQR
jgi:hypothetical protein